MATCLLCILARRSIEFSETASWKYFELVCLYGRTFNLEYIISYLRRCIGDLFKRYHERTCLAYCIYCINNVISEFQRMYFKEFLICCFRVLKHIISYRPASSIDSKVFQFTVEK